MSNEVYDFFNQTGNYLGKSYGIAVRAEIVQDILGRLNEKTILDIGCGNGLISIPYIRENEVNFLDISEKMLEEVRKNIPAESLKNATFYNCSFDNFKPDRKYDVIIAIGVLAHVESEERFIAKVHDLLKAGGVFILQFSNSESLFTKWRLSIRKNKHVLNELSYKKLLLVTKQAGFSIDREVRFSFQPPGIGLLSDPLLYKVTRASYKLKWLSRFGSDYIWNLRKKL